MTRENVLAAAVTALLLVCVCGCGSATQTPTQDAPVDTTTTPEVVGTDPAEVARQELAVEAGVEPARFLATLVGTVDDGGRSWARVTVKDTHVPAAYETVQVLLVSEDGLAGWRVVAWGSGLGSPPEDLARYGIGVEAARELFE